MNRSKPRESRRFGVQSVRAPSTYAVKWAFEASDQITSSDASDEGTSSNDYGESASDTSIANSTGSPHCYGTHTSVGDGTPRERQYENTDVDSLHSLTWICG